MIIKNTFVNNNKSNNIFKRRIKRHDFDECFERICEIKKGGGAVTEY